MATVRRRDGMSIMRFNDFLNCPPRIDIDIQNRDGDEIVLVQSEVEFLYEVLTEWFAAQKEGR